MKKESQITNAQTKEAPAPIKVKTPLKRWLLDTVNVGNAAMEAFSPENFKILMDNLRGTDNYIREIAKGGTGSNDVDHGLSLKELLKASKKSLNEARYLQSVGYLGSFYNKFEQIKDQLLKVQSLAEKEHLDFLGRGFKDDAARKHLDDLHNRINKKITANCEMAGFNKFAGLFGLFNGLKRWEKLNPSFTKELKNSISEHIKNAERVYDIFNKALWDMGGLRSERNIEGYLKSIEKILRAYFPVQISFESFYKAKIKPLVDKLPQANTKDSGKSIEQLNEEFESSRNQEQSASEITVTEDVVSTKPAIQKEFPPIQPAYQNWGKAVSVPESKPVETAPEEVNDDELEVTTPTKTEPVVVAPEIEDEEDEIQLAKEPVAKPVQEKSPALTVPGVKALKPPTKRHQANELDEVLKTHASKKISSYFEMRKRKVILKKALA